jgi:hypothetical protein
MAQYVSLVNRSSKVLEGTWDGRSYKLTPGKHSFPEAMAVKFKEQNPIMGSLDPYSLDLDYLIGIEEHGDPLTPIEQSTKAELLDRSKMDSVAALAEVITTSVGRLYANEKSSALPGDNGFVTPKL